jgi:hypothetical protein
MKVPSFSIRGCGLVILLWAAFWAVPVSAATCTSTGSGNWTQNIWSCPGGPVAGDDVIIASGHTVTMNASPSLTNFTINSGGTLVGGSGTRTLSVSGNWTNNGTFNNNGMLVVLNGASGTQLISGATTFNELRLTDNSTKNFGSSLITIQSSLNHLGGTMQGGTSTFTFQSNADITGSADKSFHNLIIGGTSVTHLNGNMFISGNLTVNTSSSLDFAGTRTTSFNGSSPQTISIASGGSAAFSTLNVNASTTVILPNLGTPQLTATSVTNNGILQQTGNTSSVQFAYIGTAYSGLDLNAATPNVNVTVAIAGNRTVCLNPSGYDHRNRCFGVRNNGAATTANVTLNTTADEDDITGDRFYEYSGGNTWTDRGACPAGDGASCTANGIVIEPGDNYFLIGTSTPPTPVTLTGFTVTRAQDANHLAWDTATEVNFAGFYVQRRAADGDFARVGDFLYAQGGPLSGASYTWTDTDLGSGPYQYRLEAVDFDQSTEFFEPTSTVESVPNATFNLYLPFSLK